jgi:copper(I)-binding protein
MTLSPAYSRGQRPATIFFHPGEIRSGSESRRPKVTRWTRRLLLAAVAVLVPVLAGCEAGLNAPTLEYHPANFGANATSNGVKILNAFILGPALNSTLPAGGRAGLFVGLAAQNGDKLVSVTAPGAARSVTVAGGPVTLAPGAVVNLAGPRPQLVLTGLTSPLAGGEFIPMTFVFAQAGAISLDVPVQPHAFEYATFLPPPVIIRPTPRATATPKVSPGATASAGGNTGSNPTASASPKS